MIDPTLFALIFGGMLAGIQGERWRAQWARSEWRARRGHRKHGVVAPFPARSAPPTDAAEQLRAVSGAQFDKRRLLSKTEARLFHHAEQAVAASGRPWRVMAQVCLGEILSCADKNAFGAINSKRVDLLIVSNTSMPVAAIEYQGEGHYQGSAPARDAIKKEALRKAGVRYIEMTPEHGPDDVAREISRLAK